MDVNRFRELPLLGILRGIEAGQVDPVVESCLAAGLQTIEVTMNTTGAANLIRAMREIAGERLTLGAGTVLTVDAFERAVDAGATFIVMPTLVRPVVDRCLRDGIPVFPGALTPQEIHDAWSAGATMVKVFPASVFGPKYLREVRGPFDRIELLACGGVRAENVAEYLACGASAVAFGASVFRSDWLERAETERLRAEIERLVEACRAGMAERVT